MSTDDYWVETRITEARKRYSLVTEAASSRIAQLLKGQLGERQLSQGDLASLAKTLLADMDSTPPKTKAKR